MTLLLQSPFYFEWQFMWLYYQHILKKICFSDQKSFYLFTTEKHLLNKVCFVPKFQLSKSVISSIRDLLIHKLRCPTTASSSTRAPSSWPWPSGSAAPPATSSISGESSGSSGGEKDLPLNFKKRRSNSSY